jgi:hypothetical protein
MDHPQKYVWNFEHEGQSIETTLGAGTNGDMWITQKNLGTLDTTSASFEQGASRKFFVSILRYINQEGLKKVCLPDGGTSLLERLKHLPKNSGNFTLSEMPPEFELSEDESRFKCPISRSYEDLSTHTVNNDDYEKTYIFVDQNKDLVLRRTLGDENLRTPVVFPKEQIQELMYSVFFMASYGLVRVSHSLIKDRRKLFLTGEFGKALENTLRDLSVFKKEQ